ncbi:MAG: hypothetical protein HY692_03025, partial [Cyanobacteria bacterium NC_groundwater_1444_Ag_S-0.65um_54_12]|nr:hypothetical protein [Cyanobacteria bacterium NC_groundwater_1444_Ag_S-0.65um_54_12]
KRLVLTLLAAGLANERLALCHFKLWEVSRFFGGEFSAIAMGDFPLILIFLFINLAR